MQRQQHAVIPGSLNFLSEERAQRAAVHARRIDDLALEYGDRLAQHRGALGRLELNAQLAIGCDDG